MFRIILLLGFIFIGDTLVSAQITLNNNNFPVGGLMISRGYAVSSANVCGNPGANQFYDFSSIKPVIHDTIKYYDASLTPWAALHPGAGVATAEFGKGIVTVNYFTSSPATFSKTGITIIADFGQGLDTVHGNYSLPDTMISNLYTYGYFKTGLSVVTIPNILPLADYKISILKTIKYDGWGTMLTPVNYYGDVLRAKVAEFRYDTVFYLGSPVYIAADSSYYYQYFAKNIRHPVATAHTDSACKLQYIEFIISPPVILGCMDTMSLNYNPLANQSDGSCIYCNINFSITPDTAICQGNTVQLNVSGGAGYLWNDGSVSSSINVSPLHTTVYSVYVSNSPVCHLLATVKVTVNEPVIAEFWTEKNKYNTGENIRFINLSSNASYYNWNFDDPDNGTSNLEFPDHTYSTTGMKHIMLTAGNSCFADSIRDTIEIISPYGIMAEDDLWGFTLYPNPGKDYLVIEGTLESDSDVEILAYDFSGRKILLKKNKIPPGKFKIETDMAEFSPGLYLVELRTSDYRIKKKWIKLQ